MANALARRYRLDVSSDGTNWVKLGAITDLAPTESPTTQAADTYDTNGFNAFEKTMTAWQIVAKFLMPTTGSVPSDAGQALISATRFQFGSAARIYARWYDRNGGTDAWAGVALVDWNQSKTGVADIGEVTATFKGDGVLEQITNPYASTSVPTISAATPSGAVAGGQVQITGAGFIGTIASTGVKFGAVSATSWIVISDSLIVAVMPAGSSGSAAVVVTNASGASSALPYTRGA
jgi:hypothetical protein